MHCLPGVDSRKISLGIVSAGGEKRIADQRLRIACAREPGPIEHR
jgi:hypothetical protein